MSFLRRNATNTILDTDSVGAGDSFRAPHVYNKTYHMIIDGDAQVTVQVSNDGEDWIDLFQSTQSEGVQNDAPWLYTRAVVDSVTTGTAKVVVGS